MVISSSEKRNWRGICIALLVISAVLGVIVFSIFLLSPGNKQSQYSNKFIHLTTSSTFHI